MPAEFSDVRISFIWAETILDAFKNAPRRAGVLGFMRQRFLFGPIFERARYQRVPVHPGLFDASSALSLEAPWPKPTGQRFWQSYLNQMSLGQLSGVNAWRSLVPLRAKLPFPIASPAVARPFEFQVFFYPHGLALFANVVLSGKLSLDAAVDSAFNIRRNQNCAIQWRPGEEESAPLDEVADMALERVRDWGWGVGSESQRTSLEPFTLVGIIQASGVHSGPVLSGSLVHRSLEAVANWRKTEVLPDLEKVRLSSHGPSRQGDSRLLYAGTRGRVLWFPKLFTSSSAGSTLACYHHNLSLASLQIESLYGLIRETATHLAKRDSLEPAENECARHAAGLLGRLYCGDRTVYRSWSLRAQIDQNNFVTDINTVRDHFGMRSLA
jgi:hypothetical protein